MRIMIPLLKGIVFITDLIVFFLIAKYYVFFTEKRSEYLRLNKMKSSKCGEFLLILSWLVLLFNFLDIFFRFAEGFFEVFSYLQDAILNYIFIWNILLYDIVNGLTLLVFFYRLEK